MNGNINILASPMLIFNISIIRNYTLELTLRTPLFATPNNVLMRIPEFASHINFTGKNVVSAMNKRMLLWFLVNRMFVGNCDLK